MNEDIARRADVKMIKSKDAEGKVIMKKAPRKEIRVESSDAYGKALEKKKEAAKLAAMSASDKDKLGRVADLMRKEREKRMSEASDIHKKVYGNMMGGLKDNKPKKPESSSDQHKNLMKKVYGNMMGGLKEMEEALRVQDTSGSLGNLKKAKPGASVVAKSHAQDTRTAAARDIKDIRKKTMGKPEDRKAALKRADYAVKREEVELGEAKDHPAAAELHAYAKKHGGIDKEYFQSAANHIAAGRHRELAMHIKNGDTEPRDHVLDTIHKHDKDLSNKIHKAAGFTRLRESEQVDEYITGKQIKMAKGIAFDPRHKGGDYTGAAKKMEKIKKGLSNHPAVKKALRAANEDTERKLMSFAEVAGQRGRPKKGEDAESDRHIIMQLRSAQDLDGNKHIEFRGGKKAKVPLHHINSILKLHDHPSATPRHKRVIRALISKGPDHLAKLASSVSKNVK